MSVDDKFTQQFTAHQRASVAAADTWEKYRLFSPAQAEASAFADAPAFFFFFTQNLLENISGRAHIIKVAVEVNCLSSKTGGGERGEHKRLDHGHAPQEI